jgi:hypothetical protein
MHGPACARVSLSWLAPVHSSAYSSIHPSIHPSTHPFNPLQSPPTPTPPHTNDNRQINADTDTVITYMVQKIGGGEDFFQSVVVKGVMEAITGAFSVFGEGALGCVFGGVEVWSIRHESCCCGWWKWKGPQWDFTT